MVKRKKRVKKDGRGTQGRSAKKPTKGASPKKKNGTSGTGPRLA